MNKPSELDFQSISNFTTLSGTQRSMVPRVVHSKSSSVSINYEIAAFRMPSDTKRR